MMTCHKYMARNLLQFKDIIVFISVRLFVRWIISLLSCMWNSHLTGNSRRIVTCLVCCGTCPRLVVSVGSFSFITCGCMLVIAFIISASILPIFTVDSFFAGIWLGCLPTLNLTSRCCSLKPQHLQLQSRLFRWLRFL